MKHPLLSPSIPLSYLGFHLFGCESACSTVRLQSINSSLNSITEFFKNRFLQAILLAWCDNSWNTGSPCFNYVYVWIQVQNMWFRLQFQISGKGLIHLLRLIALLCIQKWVGHADYETTLKIYAKVKDKEAKSEISNTIAWIIPLKDYTDQ